MATRLHCRPCAFEYFARQMPLIDSSGGQGLLHAALAISMHELGEVDVPAVDRQLKNFADTVRQRVPHLVDQLLHHHPINPEPVLAHLHSVLFEEFGLAGNMTDYYNPHNSYITSVLESCSGIPISLTLIYKNVAERLGLHVHGINAPGHFLAAVDQPPESRPPDKCGHGRMFIDPFCGGRFLTRDEVGQLLEQTLGRPLPYHKNMLAPATNRQWLNRILQNLQNIFAFTRREADLAAMQEMTALLQGAA